MPKCGDSFSLIYNDCDLGLVVACCTLAISSLLDKYIIKNRKRDCEIEISNNTDSAR